MIVAVADDADPDHLRCEDLLDTHSGPLVTTAMVVAEAGWLIERQLGPAAEARFYTSIAEGDLSVETFTAADWARISQLVERYGDLGLGGTDASLVTIAERLNITQLATLDRRDFTVVRPSHCDAFELLP